MCNDRKTHTTKSYIKMKTLFTFLFEHKISCSNIIKSNIAQPIYTAEKMQLARCILKVIKCNLDIFSDNVQ